MQRRGRPMRGGDSNFSQLVLRLSGVLRANLKGAEKKTDSPKASFWTTVSPHDAFSAPLALSEPRQNRQESRLLNLRRLRSSRC